MKRKDADRIFDILKEAVKEVVVDVVGVSYDCDIPTIHCSINERLFEVQIGVRGTHLYRGNIPAKAVIKCLGYSVNVPEVPIFIEFYKGGNTNEQTKTE